MIALALAVLTYCRAFFIGRHRLGLEVAALRQQLVAFCPNISARITIPCIDPINGKPIFEFSRSLKSRLFLKCRFRVPS